ncbi:MAG TPA: aromatic ring-hydroxylating dioxygenase subunit alpha [Alphaproteobacteria bacterium]|nr:aromatic ring-hydroxylating dioxygenase subunit alpha [Alphaproteobacteria bacterium]
MTDARGQALAPLLEASALPGWCYASPEFFAWEMAEIHRRHWLFAGRVEELVLPGDFRAIDTAGGPVILLRDGEGTLRALANCCRHRGSLLLAGSGNLRAIRCPYHAWSYRLDGSLLAAPNMERTEGFEPAAHGLIPVRLECWQGFVFLNFDPAAPDLMTALGDLPERLAGYRFAEMSCTWRAEIECRCNWKLLVENALEAYHTGMVHRESVGAQREAVIPTRGDWLCLQVLSETSIAVLGDRPPFPPIAALSPEAARGTYFTMIMPTTQFACAQDCMWWLAMRPIGPQRTLLSLGGCFPKATTALPDFAAQARPYYERWERVAREDVAMLERQQEGLASPLYRPGRLSWRDALVHEVHRWLAARVPAELWRTCERAAEAGQDPPP